MASAAAFAFVRDRDRDETSRRESFFDWLSRMENLDPETSEFWQLADQIEDETANAISFRWHAKNTQAAQDRVMRDYWTYVKVSRSGVLSFCRSVVLTPNLIGCPCSGRKSGDGRRTGQVPLLPRGPFTALEAASRLPWLRPRQSRSTIQFGPRHRVLSIDVVSQMPELLGCQSLSGTWTK